MLKYEFIDKGEDGGQTLFAKVRDDKSADGFAMVEMINNFNDLSPEEVARQIIFNQLSNILDEGDKEYYNVSMAALGFSDDKAKEYNLDKNIVNPILGFTVESGESRGRYIDLAAREAATQQGAVIAGNTVFNRAHKSTTNSADAANAISTAYQSKPAGGRLSQNPLNPRNMKVTAINQDNSAKIHDDNTNNVFASNNSELIEISLDPRVGPSFVIPIYDSSYKSKKAIPQIMSFLDQKIIDQFRQGSDYKPFTLEDIKQFMGTYSGKKDYFDEFQMGYKAMLDKGGSSFVNGPLGSGQTSEKGDDPVGEDEAGAADEVSTPNPGNSLFGEKKKPINSSSQPQSKPVLQPLKVNIGDGKDYQRRMLNFENTRGSSSGGGVSNYGFTGADMKSKFDKESGTKEEKALKVIDKHIIGQNKSTFESILYDLGIDRSAFNALPEIVKEQLVDWKFNTGRSVADLVYIASDIDPNYTGFVAHRAKAKTPSEISSIDISKLTKSALSKARKELYEGRIKSMEDMLARGSKKVTKADIDFAKQGYNNSQKYRLQ